MTKTFDTNAVCFVIVKSMIEQGLDPHETIMVAAELLDSTINTAEEVYPETTLNLRQKAVDYIAEQKLYTQKDHFVLEDFENKKEAA